MSSRDTLRWEENLVAAIAGFGILLAMVAGMVIGFGSDDNELTSLLFQAGLGLVAIGTALWLVLLQPWKNFDDLQTPYFTGHHHQEEHHDEHHMDATDTAELSALAEAPTREREEDMVPLPSEDVTEVEEEAVEELVEPVEERVEEIQAEAPAAEAKAEVEAEPEPEATDAEAVDEDREDNLRLIEGIGPKTEEALKTYGIKTFAAIAAYDAVELERLVKDELSVRLVGSTATWVRQAKLAAAGELNELEELQARIKSGYLYDDLTRIEGIGPKIQEALYEAKIRAYDELAHTSVEDLQAALDAAGLSTGRHMETWAEQAALIVKGDLTGFQALKDRL